MALLVLLKGVNVGGHRAFRPSVLANELSSYGAVNIGAAGTFIIRKKVSQVQIRAEITRRLPFQTEIVICADHELLRFTSRDPFAGHRTKEHIVQFVTVLAKPRQTLASVPMDLPSAGRWTIRVLGHDGRFVYGLYRREMKAIQTLSQLQKIFGVAATTRSWSTIVTASRLLHA